MSLGDFFGNIVIDGESASFVPNDDSYPRLIWNLERQCFVLPSNVAADDAVSHVSKDSEKAVCDVVDDGVMSDASSSGFEDFTPVRCIPCYALFGVLRIGSASILLYVSERERVTTLTIGETHDVFAVKQLSWLRLPETASDLSVNKSGDGDDGGSGEKDEASASQGSSQSHAREEMVLEYCRVVDSFCAQSEQHCGASYFYYSPTANLTLEPGDVVKGMKEVLTPSLNGSSVKGGGAFSLAISSEGQISQRVVFQWNSPLLGAFDEVVASLNCDYHVYVPAFIRGIVEATTSPEEGVQMLLINRLSYRWAGTRYNRRGLDNAGSGIAANFSASTLWVFPLASGNEGDKAANEKQRVAAFTILRGSVPRCWSQPANLTFIPTITISSPSSGVDELVLHLNALLALFDGMTSIHCLDTTSLSKAELPISKAFEAAALKLREGNGALSRPVDVYYTKYNVKERRAKNAPYNLMRMEVDTLLNRKNEGGSQFVDFWKFSNEGHPSPSSGSSPPSVPSTADADGATCELVLVHQQKHYVRVNCLDCLDRTNLVQSMIAINILPQMIRYVLGHGEEMNLSDDEDEYEDEDDGSDGAGGNGEFHCSVERCKHMWVELGISLSRLYAGSDPHFVDFLLTGEWGPATFDVVRIALRRWWQQNFFDGQKQDAVSLLTCQHDPALFHTQFESPFSRNFSGLNRMVLGGMAAAVLATLVSFSMLFVPRYWMRGEILFFVIFWMSYIALTISRILKDGVSYTNYPLLK